MLKAILEFIKDNKKKFIFNCIALILILQGLVVSLSAGNISKGMRMAIAAREQGVEYLEMDRWLHGNAMSTADRGIINKDFPSIRTYSVYGANYFFTFRKSEAPLSESLIESPRILELIYEYDQGDEKDKKADYTVIAGTGEIGFDEYFISKAMAERIYADLGFSSIYDLIGYDGVVLEIEGIKKAQTLVGIVEGDLPEGYVYYIDSFYFSEFFMGRPAFFNHYIGDICMSILVELSDDLNTNAAFFEKYGNREYGQLRAYSRNSI